MRALMFLGALTVVMLLPRHSIADDWYDWQQITRILAHNDSLEITLDGDVDCNRTFRLRDSEPNYAVKSSALLSAYFAGHEVSVFYSGALNNCSTALHRLKVRR